MSRWTRCPACQLSHQIRPDGICPRCGAVVEAQPKVQEREAGPIPDAVTSAAVYDPAAQPQVTSAPIRVRAWALFVVCLGSSITAWAIWDQDVGAAAAAALLTIGAGLTAWVART